MPAVVCYIGASGCCASDFVTQWTNWLNEGVSMKRPDGSLLSRTAPRSLRTWIQLLAGPLVLGVRHRELWELGIFSSKGAFG